MNDDSFERSPYDDTSSNYHKSQKFGSNDPKPTFLSSSSKRNQYSNKSIDRQSAKKTAHGNQKKDKQLRREMRKRCKETPLDQRQNCTKAFQMSFNLTSAAAAAAMRNNKDRRAEMKFFDAQNSNASRLKQANIPPYRNPQYLNTMRSNVDTNDNRRNNDGSDEEALKQQILQRTIRSHHQRRNASNGMHSTSRHDHPHSIETTNLNDSVSADVSANVYKEKIDLNPDLCYKVSGLSYSQQKLCASNTQIMPAISRGARAAIQVI